MGNAEEQPIPRRKWGVGNATPFSFIHFPSGKNLIKDIKKTTLLSLDAQRMVLRLKKPGKALL